MFCMLQSVHHRTTEAVGRRILAVMTVATFTFADMPHEQSANLLACCMHLLVHHLFSLKAQTCTSVSITYYCVIDQPCCMLAGVQDQQPLQTQPRQL